MEVTHQLQTLGCLLSQVGLTSINVRTSAGGTGGLFCRTALLRLQGQFQLMIWLRMWVQSFLKSSFPRRWPSTWITNIFKTTGELWVFRQNPLKSCGGSYVFHFPVQICGLINIHRLLLFTPQQLVLIEKFTGYSFSLYTGYHRNKDVSTEEECTRLPPPVKDLLLNSVKRVTHVGKTI